MNSAPDHLQRIKDEAVARLNTKAAELRASLDAGRTHQRVWEPDQHGLRTKVGRGYLRVFHAAEPAPNRYPGIRYSSSMGPNSDDSYSGFLPGVTFDEALLLVYGEFKRHKGEPT